MADLFKHQNNELKGFNESDTFNQVFYSEISKPNFVSPQPNREYKEKEHKDKNFDHFEKKHDQEEKKLIIQLKSNNELLFKVTK